MYLGESFGFRISDEHLFSGARGDMLVPDAGTFLQGDLVEVDTAAPGYLKKSAANATLIPQIRGLIVQYDQLFRTQGATGVVIDTTRDLSKVVNGQLAVITTGAGLKVWVKNLAAVTAVAGVSKGYAAETRCDVTSVVVGDMIKWDGSKYVRTTTASEAIGRCTGEVSSTGFAFVLLG